MDDITLLSGGGNCHLYPHRTLNQLHKEPWNEASADSWFANLLALTVENVEEVE